MYRVINVFTDLKDGNHKYNVGDVYPRKGTVVSDKRLEELSSSKNKRGIPMIEEIPEKVSPLPKETLEDVEADVNPPKRRKSKKNAEKAQE